jgi:hypothetical protein
MSLEDFDDDNMDDADLHSDEFYFSEPHQQGKRYKSKNAHRFKKPPKKV